MKFKSSITETLLTEGTIKAAADTKINEDFSEDIDVFTKEEINKIREYINRILAEDPLPISNAKELIALAFSRAKLSVPYVDQDEKWMQYTALISYAVGKLYNKFSNTTSWRLSNRISEIKKP